MAEVQRRTPVTRQQPVSSQRKAVHRPEPLFPPTSVFYSGGDGSSISNAVIITGTMSSRVGVDAEKYWYNHQHGWTPVTKQALLDSDGRHYDAITFQPDGAPVTVYYDISDFFGKDRSGAWRFVDSEDNTVLRGDISDMDAALGIIHPWSDAVAKRSGELVYQYGPTVESAGSIHVGPVVDGRLHGTWIVYSFGTPTGPIQMDYVRDQRHGLLISWYTNGVKETEQEWEHGKQTGSLRVWDEAGRPLRLVHFKNGQLHGLSYYRDRQDGRGWTVLEFDMGKCIKAEGPSDPPPIGDISEQTVGGDGQPAPQL